MEETSKRRRLGKYELLTRLGQGGMGEVWKARDTQLQRYVAIKLMHAELRNNADFASHFMREARLVASLRHPNIVQLHDFQLTGQEDEQGYAYMVMDYIEGGTLADALRTMVRKGVFWSAQEIISLFTSISLALDYAHEQGMIHRDIKPANILLDRSLAPAEALGQPILTDFGIARWQGSGSTVTGFLGTPLYVSPEQAQGRQVDARSDLYSLGIVLYEVLTGQTPFHGDNPLGIMMQHLDSQPPAPEHLNPRISPALSAVILQSIAKDPRQRFSSAGAMTKALATAFNMPVPTLLSGSGASFNQYNPLQPSRGSSIEQAEEAQYPTIRAQYTGVNTHFTQDRLKEMPAERAVPRTHVPLHSVESLHPYSVSKKTGLRGHSRLAGGAWRWLLLGGVIVLVLGLGITFLGPRLFQTSRPASSGASPAIVGHLLFRNSAGRAGSPWNEMQIDLDDVESPPAGQIYYAWLMQADSEVTVPHWALTVTNGAIHDGHTAAPQTDLLATSNLFLITEEASGSVPVIASPLPQAHLYYAQLKPVTTGVPTFAISHCPTTHLNSPTNPCR